LTLFEKLVYDGQGGLLISRVSLGDPIDSNATARVESVNRIVRRAWGVSLALLALVGAPCLHAQEPPQRSDGGFSLEQNYPNPFNPETRIPFVLDEDLFAEGKLPLVSIRIFNILQQPVAVPTALRHPLGEVPVAGLEYPAPGRYEAYWDGSDDNGRPVASGIYLMQLNVNGVSQTRKMYVTK